MLTTMMMLGLAYLSVLVGGAQALTDASAPAATMSPQMIGSPIGPSDYPQQAMRAHQEGYVSVEMTVSADGAASSCQVTESSGAASLDEATCRKLLRARFDPARDPHGNASSGTFHTAIGWLLPTPGTVPDNRVFVPVAMMPKGYERPTWAFMTFDAAGIPTACEIKKSSGSKAFDDVACAALRREMKVAPPHGLGKTLAAGYRNVPVAAAPTEKR